MGCLLYMIINFNSQSDLKCVHGLWFFSSSVLASVHFSDALIHLMGSLILFVS